jgi:protoheme IX farnesyltransferase
MNSHVSLDRSEGVARPATWPRIADLVALAKPRVTTMVLATSLGGLFMAPGRAPWATVAWTMLGTALIVGGANALNMYLERDSDRFMTRTATRPLPSGRMAPWVALVFGLTLSVAALPVLTLGAHPVAAALAAVASLSYVFGYTLLKPWSWTALLVGAVPGAIPPLLGNAAVTGAIEPAGIALFVILFVWQVPHFHAIALFRREEYARAGLKVLPTERGERVTKAHIVVTTMMLAGVSILPWSLRLVTPTYLVVVAALNVVFIGWAIAGLRRDAGVRWARSFFAVSLPWLVLVFAALLATRTLFGRCARSGVAGWGEGSRTGTLVRGDRPGRRRRVGGRAHRTCAPRVGAPWTVRLGSQPRLAERGAPRRGRGAGGHVVPARVSGAREPLGHARSGRAARPQRAPRRRSIPRLGAQRWRSVPQGRRRRDGPPLARERS